MNFLIKTRSTREQPQQSVWSRANEIISLGETGHRSGGVKRSRDDAREAAFAAAKVMFYRLSVQCPKASQKRCYTDRHALQEHPTMMIESFEKHGSGRRFIPGILCI